MAILEHLVLQELSLSGGTEWRPEAQGWLVFRVREGAGYWLSQNVHVPLAVGDVGMVSANGAGALLASRVGGLVVQFCRIDSHLLLGLLTLNEVHCLKTILEAPSRPFQHFPAAHPVAQRFAMLSEMAPGVDLVARCHWLLYWAEWVNPALGKGPTVDSQRADPTSRFARLVQTLPEEALAEMKAVELARLCGCSQRHFARLFRDQFGQSMRNRQVELRLQKARKLLSDSDAKVITVAHESGFRHLGLFNLMFKRRFGMTPTQWRQSATRKRVSRPTRAAGLVPLLALLLFGMPSGNAAPDPAGQASATPSTAPGTVLTNAVPTFAVKRYQVEGSSVLPTNIAEQATAPFTGDAVTLDTIKKGLGALKLALSNRGYVTVVPFLPPQQLTNGVVRVQLIEGRLADITVSGNHWFNEANVRRALPSLHTNILLNSYVFQTELDRANANRDRQIYPEVEPGPEPGTTALRLKVKDQFPLHAKMELNNQSTPGTPDLRLNTSVQYNNLWQEEHSMGLQYGFSPEGMRSYVKLPEHFLEAPLVAFYSGYYRMPIGNPDSMADALAARPGNFGYDEATRRFKMPPTTGQPELAFFASRAANDTGVIYGPKTQTAQTATTTIYSQDTGETTTLNESFGLRLNVPVPDFVGIRSTLSLGADTKHFASHGFSTNNFITHSEIPNPPPQPPTIEEGTTSHPQPETDEAVTYLPLTLRWDASRSDPLGSTTFSMNYVVNFNIGGISSASDFRRISSSPKGSGDFVTANFSLAREQKIVGAWSALLRADGQWANQPLISNEQFANGGVNGVRGYREGEEYGDTGWRVVFEPRTPVWELGMVDRTLPFRIRGSIFMDYGETYLLDPQGRQPHERLWGTGAGVSGSIGPTWDFRAAVGIPLNSVAGTRAGITRFHVSVGAQF